MNNTAKNMLISLTLFVVVSGRLGLQRCRTKCLEEGIRCTAGSVLLGEAVNCLVVKYRCKERCYKDQIAMLKTKLLQLSAREVSKMMNIVEDADVDLDDADDVVDVQDDNVEVGIVDDAEDDNYGNIDLNATQNESRVDGERIE